MITLYQFPTSPFCEKIRRLLGYKALPYRLIDVPRAAVADYRDVSPIGKFPAIDHDGTKVWDSTDIAEYLERIAPDPTVLPNATRDRALAHVIEDWADESLYLYEIEMRLAWRHNLLPLVPSFAATMPSVPEHQVADFVEKAAKAMTTAQGLGRKPVDQVVRDAERHLHAIDGLVGDGGWLVGSHLSIADLSVVPQLNALLCTREVVEATSKMPRIMAWRRRVMDAAPDHSGRRSEPGAET
ncbi:MAG: glutathione S-transferase family protein [Gammaproteobacteria bacterium]|nr:glutathione S-transferase family protein [Gammaproteobacteria bacterium]